MGGADAAAVPNPVVPIKSAIAGITDCLNFMICISFFFSRIPGKPLMKQEKLTEPGSRGDGHCCSDAVL
jgi:hypothetical protein